MIVPIVAIPPSIELGLAPYRDLFPRIETYQHRGDPKAWVLGNDRFKEQIEAITGRRAAPLPKGRPGKKTIS